MSIKMAAPSLGRTYKSRAAWNPRFRKCNPTRMAASNLTVCRRGLFLLTTTGEGFVTQTLWDALRPGESYVVPPITMSLATVVTEVRVSPSIEEIAPEEFEDLEQQRVLGIVPNFYDYGSGTKRSLFLYAVACAWRIVISPIIP